MKRTQALIRNKIQEELKKRPMTAYELGQCFDPPVNVRTVYRALFHLASLGVVGEGRFDVKRYNWNTKRFNPKQVMLWQLKHPEVENKFIKKKKKK